MLFISQVLDLCLEILILFTLLQFTLTSIGLYSQLIDLGFKTHCTVYYLIVQEGMFLHRFVRL